MPKTVLAVDTSTENLRLYVACFRNSAYRLITAPRPIDAFNETDARAKSRETIDLLITHLEISGTLGSIDLIRNVRVVSPQTRFMLCGDEEESNRLISSLRNEGIEVRYLPRAYLENADKLIDEVKSLIDE